LGKERCTGGATRRAERLPVWSRITFYTFLFTSVVALDFRATEAAGKVYARARAFGFDAETEKPHSLLSIHGKHRYIWILHQV
jgi:hypothetical protein